MEENYLQITVVGKGGFTYGTVIYDKIHIEDITGEKILKITNELLAELREAEEKFPPTTDVNGLPIK